MTPTQREAALRLADDLEYENQKVSHDAADLLRELAAAPQGEPVAWCSLTPSGKIAYFDGKPMVMPGAVGNEVHRTPLYTHPPQQRKPLTDYEIDRFWMNRPDLHDGELLPQLRDFARAIERAHGITGEPT